MPRELKKKQVANIELYAVPPSINGFYGQHGKHKYITNKGREFKQYVEDCLARLVTAEAIKPFGDKRIKLTFEFHFKGKRKRDTSNYIKSLEDCLSGILFTDDEQIDEIVARRSYHAPEHLTVINIEEIC